MMFLRRQLPLLITMITGLVMAGGIAAGLMV